MLKQFPFFFQLDAMDCGAACLKMIAKFYGKSFSLESLREKCFINREGVSLLGISDAAESISLHTLAARLSYKNLAKEAPLPCIVLWREKHFLVVYKIKKDKVYVADPGHGLLTYSEEDFQKAWICTKGNEEPEGFALFLEPTPTFYEDKEEKKTDTKAGLKHYLSYLLPFKRYYFQLFLSLTVATLIQLIFPFLTQALVDIGINNHDLSFIYLILIAQVVLFLSGKSSEFIRSWLLLHMTTRVNLSIVSDFLIKLMKLPVSFFDRKTTGDLLQRMQDHERIQSFFTSSSVNFLFTLVNILVFGTILAIYNSTIFFIFAISSVLYFTWIFLFLRRRKELDYRNFDQAILNQNNTIQLITGIQEIKLQNCEKQKRWEWERIQAKYFKLSIQGLALGQIEQTGASIINELKNILLTFYSASLVIQGEMTLGMMLAIQYIVGQLNTPIAGLIEFMHAAQKAQLSIERLTEIHNKEDEEVKDQMNELLVNDSRDIVIKDLSFQYGSQRSPFVFENFNLTILKGKVTAVVGSSGSGKTTLLKLLLRSYEPTKGSICWGETNIKNISYKTWRNKFGCVMQESFIFSDSIAKNIAIGEEIVNKERLKYATITANIREFIEQLPVEYNTKIGQDGVGLSQGQKQRILISRAIYKDSEILLLDEATNSLDANNEKIIINNLNEYFKGKTVVVVAHRLSTVKNADQIVVLEKGRIVEVGNHEKLVKQQGAYFNLIKNQLELGN